ncbi:Zinc knuckle CX2CX4HX4C [Trema orientale]|uniref:Zinc knuckle CX2CX4HX4C n=1 Tax=Trema orientale TaxID=63057 RepID=A0A2P5CN95_TREOI|nr:Zinc knuckle CX2CX4HX4C [Trema orientale]
MASPLDCYTTAFLLSAYGFNDYRLKSNQKSGNHAPSSPNSVDSVTGGSFLVDHVQDHVSSPPHNLAVHDLARPVQDSTRVSFESPRLASATVPGVGPSASVDANVGFPILDSGLPSASVGAHGLVSDGAYGLVRERNPGVSSASGCKLVQEQVTGLGDISSPHVSFKVIDSNLGPKNKGVVSDSNPTSQRNGGVPSFAQILNSQGLNSASKIVDSHASLIASETSKPTIKGNYVCVKVNEYALKNRLDLCQFSLIGRIFLSKGDSPWKLVDLKLKLQSIWKLSSAWRLISLGKGFFHILLSSEEEKNRVRTMGSMNLKPGILRLQPWYPNFNPNTQSFTNSQIWVRFHELPWVYWDCQILSDLARGVGVQIRFDEMTLKGEFGHYACILIDIDLSQPLSDSLMVEVGLDCLFVPLEYERLPNFCTSCKTIGHLAYACRRGHLWLFLKNLNPKWREVALDLVAEFITQLLNPQKATEPAVNPTLAFQLPSAVATTDVLTIDEQALNCHANLSSVNLAPAVNQVGYSSIEEPKSDSLNTSDLSPTKVFASRDEGWQEVQSRKKKKAPLAQFSWPVTRSTKSTSQ